MSVSPIKLPISYFYLEQVSTMKRGKNLNSLASIKFYSQQVEAFGSVQLKSNYSSSSIQLAWTPKEKFGQF